MELPQGTIIASGPVIIENGKILLNKEKKEYGSTVWMIPGGMVENFDISLEETCRREVKEELGIDIKIIRPLRTIIQRRPQAEDKLVILVHYLAERIGEIKPGPETIEWAWHDINNLPSDCAPNVYEIIKDLK
ncbi:MAG: NUDIX hydrolase [Candidatus Magasanikbacteria bacterium]|nr:NUDIX hydrolase [Candidatus Magasanikbacteria bacterium]